MKLVQLLDADSARFLLVRVFMALALGAGLIPNYRSK
jgi:hypothetical protein